MRQLTLHPNNCEMIFTNGTFSDRQEKLSVLVQHISKSYTSAILITDQNISSLYGSLICNQLQIHNFPFTTLTFPPGEEAKSLLSANRCWDQMVAFQLDRKSCVIALGGGVISDLAGFASACYMRGIDLINIPTTLLGMVDASMGGKTGINLPEGKNLIGCFHHAKYIFVCPSFLQTLPEREYCAGLAEVIKYGVIRDPLFFSFLEENMESILNKSPDKLKSLIFRCCEIKSQVIQEDPEDKNDIRAVLNWGHTFAHAIEAAKGYREILHGEAVAIGMSCAASVSEHLGYAKPEFIERQDRLLKKAKLKIAIPNISYDQLLNFMQKDKKNKSGRISLIVAEKIGKVFKHPDVDMNNIKEALRKKETRIH